MLTIDHVVFTVPHTHDMVSQLLSPSQPKNVSDLVVLAVLAVHILGLVLLPQYLRIPVFAVAFLFWRACYNGGIGVLLREQSKNKTLVTWAKKLRLFTDPKTGQNPHPKLYKLLKTEMETKIPRDYKFENAPIEYNTWLTFRRIVDLVLMCDFVSYCLFAIACSGRPDAEHVAVTIGRWISGLVLVLFNLWVKLDAHRVVKDYAWYWGDFFFLIDQELTFDGVFEMAPHPMYSVGYAGYYGISLLAASYKVLFISIVAHAAQFAFLILVENPHIDKTYNAPPPRNRVSETTLEEDGVSNFGETDEALSGLYEIANTKSQKNLSCTLLGVHNMDFHRVTDVAGFLVQLYLYSLALLTPSTRFYQTLFLGNALAWRLWYSIGIGYILDRQSKKKKWTRHFIKYGEGTKEAWREWKGVYSLSMTMCYASFVVAALKMYQLPLDWTYGMATLRHVLGVGMIALQLWTVFSIQESLGEFGFFYGDFFVDRPPKLTYSGIYRFLNNPERVIGLAGVWGIAIISFSKAIFFLALLSHVLTLFFIQVVERPHMQKLYGRRLRKDSGISKTFKRSLPPTLQRWQSNVDRIFEESVDFVEDLIDSAQPKLAAGVDTIVKDYQTRFRNYPARISITRLAPDLAGFEPKDYSLSFSGTIVSDLASADKYSGREGEDGRRAFFKGSEFRPVMLEYGTPIKVKWIAPIHHSKKDWIGLYMIADNASKEITRIASQGRWIATCKGIYDSRADNGILTPEHKTTVKNQHIMTGEVEFSGDKLWWTTGGVFEFRYHHDGKHNVMATSKPFEIHIARFDEDDVEVNTKGSMKGAVGNALLPVVRNCFDRDPEIAPNTVDEAFGALVERDGKFAKRVVFALKLM